MSAKHTPGPWGTIGLHDGKRYYESLIVGGKNGGIAEMLLHSDEQKLTAEANARLIAAAPDMLEALQKIVKLGATADLPDAWAIARAALAKAQPK